jgi:hypothetical protein
MHALLDKGVQDHFAARLDDFVTWAATLVAKVESFGALEIEGGRSEGTGVCKHVVSGTFGGRAGRVQAELAFDGAGKCKNGCAAPPASAETNHGMSLPPSSASEKDHCVHPNK